MENSIEITKEEIWHIISIMEERGVGHCEFCKDLLLKLKDKYGEMQ